MENKYIGKEWFYIGEVINFQRYVNAKEDEKRRIKTISVLNNRLSAINAILNSIDDCIGVSLVTKYFGESNEIVGKEHIIDNSMCQIIVSSILDYKETIKNTIEELYKEGELSV